MKKIFLPITFFLACFLLLITDVHAATKDEVLNQQITDLKSRIASRVAQLKLVERRGVIGVVTDISNTQITLTDVQNNIKFIDVDELTKFSSPSATESFGISDITKGSTIGVLGLYNKESRRILARFINAISFPKIIHGVVALVNDKDFVLNVVDEKGEIIYIDVETITRTSSYTKEGGLVRFGFSKIKENQRIYIIGFRDIKNKNRLIASRIIIFPEIPKNPKIKIPQSALDTEAQITPSTGSGKKLTPITK